MLAFSGHSSPQDVTALYRSVQGRLKINQNKTIYSEKVFLSLGI